MKMIRLILILATAGFLASCGTDQDPFHDRSDAIKNGQLPESKPAHPPSIAADAMKIDTEDIYSIKEGSTLKIQIAGRVLLPNVKFTVSVVNMDEFPGATFDAATGEFIWTPMAGTVQDDTFDLLGLKLILLTEPNAVYPVSMSKTKDVELRIYRNYGQPEIVSITDTGDLREGDFGTFEIKVRDVDARVADDVHVTATSTEASTISLVSRIAQESVSQDSQDKTLWRVQTTIDLRGLELTTSRVRVPVDFSSHSRFNKVSPLQRTTFDIVTDLEKPASSWRDVFQVTAGETSRFSFVVYDPKSEGEIELKWIDDVTKVLPGSTMACATSGVSTQVCNLTVQPLITNVGRATLRLAALNKSRVANDSYSVASNFKFRIDVATPTTTTSTTTTTLQIK